MLVFTPIIAISTLGEPPFTATTEQAYAFLVQREQWLAGGGERAVWCVAALPWSGSSSD